jgi:zinc transporter 9
MCARCFADSRNARVFTKSTPADYFELLSYIFFIDAARRFNEMATPVSSMKTVLIAMTGNFFVTTIKFIAWFFSGSGAMLSEAIHSAADTGNQILLYLGLRRASKRSDDEFQYGYGSERFVFGLLSAAGIFFVGCGVTVVHGLESLFEDHAPEISGLTFIILGVSAFIEGTVLLLAIRSMKKEANGMPFSKYLKEKADPAAVAILFEDSVAVGGLFIAAAGIAASHYTHNPMYDALSSLLIGLLLGYVAIHLIIENRKLLLGKSVPEGVEEKFIELLEANPIVKRAHDVKTRQLTPELYSFKAELTLDADYLAEQMVSVARKSAPDTPQAMRNYAHKAIAVISEEIANLEKAIQKEIPEAKYIDIEIDQNPAVSTDE